MSLHRWPRRLAVFVLAAFILSTVMAPAAGAADPQWRPSSEMRLGRGPLPVARYTSLDDAVSAGALDEVVLSNIRANGHADAIVTFDGDPILTAASARAPQGRGRSEAILAAIRPAFASQKQQALKAAGAGAGVLREYENLAASFIRFRSPGALLAALNGPEVTGVRQDRLHQRQLTQSQELVGRNDPTIATQQGAGTAVAVLDTGVDYMRSAFGTCGAGPGTAGCKVAYAQDFATNDGVLDEGAPDCLDAASTGACHGTNVAGIVLGVAPATQILALDVFEPTGAPDSVINAAINWLVANRARYNVVAMNLSLGLPVYATSTCWNSPQAPAFASARTVGMVPVVAAGNSADAGGSFTLGISTPACTPGAVSVGAVYDADLGSDPFGCGDATTAADVVTCFSETGPNLTLLAPGAIIDAAGVTQGGTSQAAPHVAGAVAVLKAAKPTATPYQVERVLATSGDPIVDARPEPDITKRRLDLPQLLAAALPAQPMWAEPQLTIGPPSRAAWSLWSSLSLSATTSTRYLHHVHSRGATPTAVQYMRSTNQGASWAAAKRLNATAQDAHYPVSASSGASVYAAWLAWGTASPFRRVLWFRANTSHGAPTRWQSAKALTPTSGSNAYVDPPSIAASGAYVYAVWTEASTGSIRFRRSADRGVTWSTPKTLGTTTATSSAGGRWGTPVVTAAGAYVAVSWIASNTGALKAEISSNRGGTWTSTVSLDSNANDRPSLASVNSRIAFGWTDPTGVRVRIWNAGTWLTSGPRTVASFSSAATYKTGYSPAIAITGSGTVEVVWSGCRLSGCSTSASKGTDLLWRRSTNNGSTWARQSVLADSRRSSFQRINDAADIAFVSASRRHVAWDGYTPSTWSSMYVRTGG